MSYEVCWYHTYVVVMIMTMVPAPSGDKQPSCLLHLALCCRSVLPTSHPYPEISMFRNSPSNFPSLDPFTTHNA